MTHLHLPHLHLPHLHKPGKPIPEPPVPDAEPVAPEREYDPDPDWDEWHFPDGSGYVKESW